MCLQGRTATRCSQHVQCEPDTAQRCMHVPLQNALYCCRPAAAPPVLRRTHLSPPTPPHAPLLLLLVAQVVQAQRRELVGAHAPHLVRVEQPLDGLALALVVLQLHLQRHATTRRAGTQQR